MGCALSAPLSLWFDDPTLDRTPRAPLPGDRDADVVIVGAGFTGLWTAHYLAAADPSLRVVVLEAETAGFGASGRNGGWCSALFPASGPKLAALPGSSADLARAQHAAMRDSVAEVGRAARALGIDAHYVRGGTIVVARNRAQLARARAEAAAAAAWGEDVLLLSAGEATARLAATRTLGATYTPDCARIQPALLARGLASAVERQGVLIHEGTPVTGIEPGVVTTPRGRVRAEVVVRATEGYTPVLPGLRRQVAPVHSVIIASEPLTTEVWEQIGLRERETFSDHRHLIVYGQRTADDRIVFGGRGAPYAFGSRVQARPRQYARVFAGLHAALIDLFPVLEGTRFTHAWGGVLGIPRDWTASVGLDRDTGLAWAGGYVGDGVATTNLAGRTLRDLVLGQHSSLTRLPWVGHRSPAWEPEPLRWLGINTGLRAMSFADTEERLTGRSSLLARAVAPLLG